jgi:tetratricopeptide (TPR) repeat protein
MHTYLAKELGDMWVAVRSLIYLAYRAWLDRDLPAAILLSAEAVALSREMRDQRNLALALQYQGRWVAERGDAARAVPLLEESLGLFRELQERWAIEAGLLDLAWAAVDQRRYEDAMRLGEDNLALAEESGRRWEIARCSSLLGFTEQRLGNVNRAATWYRTGLASNREEAPAFWVAGCLLGIAGLSLAQGQISRATRLLSSIDSLFGTEGPHLSFSQRGDFQRHLAAARTALGEEAFAAAWEAGRAMSLEDAVAFALEGSSYSPGQGE